MANVTLTIILKDAYVTRCLTAFNALADKEIYTKIDDWIEWKWSYLTKQTGENNKQYGERILKQFVRSLVRNYEYNIDHERYENDVKQIYDNIDTIEQPSQNVPDGIVE